MSIGRGKKLVSSTAMFDWKNDPGKEDLQSALKPHGLYVHDADTNDDSAAYHIANRKMSRSEINSANKELNFPDGDDEE